MQCVISHSLWCITCSVDQTIVIQSVLLWHHFLCGNLCILSEPISRVFDKYQVWTWCPWRVWEGRVDPQEIGPFAKCLQKPFRFCFWDEEAGHCFFIPPPRPQCTLRWGLLSLNVSSVGKIEPFRYDRGNALKSCFGNCPNKQRSLSIRWRLN